MLASPSPRHLGWSRFRAACVRTESPRPCSAPTGSSSLPASARRAWTHTLRRRKKTKTRSSTSPAPCPTHVRRATTSIARKKVGRKIDACHSTSNCAEDGGSFSPCPPNPPVLHRRVGGPSCPGRRTLGRAAAIAGGRLELRAADDGRRRSYRDELGRARRKKVDAQVRRANRLRMVNTGCRHLERTPDG